MIYILKTAVEHTNTPAKNKYFSAYSYENCNMKQKGNYNLMFVLGERHHCKPKQQPFLGIWLLLLVVSPPGFQQVQGRAAAGPSTAGVVKRQPLCLSPVAKLSGAEALQVTRWQPQL